MVLNLKFIYIHVTETESNSYDVNGKNKVFLGGNRTKSEEIQVIEAKWCICVHIFVHYIHKLYSIYT